MTKKNIVEKIIEAQKSIINDLEKSIKLYRAASDLDEDDTLDPEDLSHQAEAKDMQLRLQQKLIREKNALSFLELNKDKHSTKVESGALVETDKNYIYIGVSILPITINNKQIICISVKAPIVSKLQNKTKGDEIKLGTALNKIINIS